ncbi:MAG: hypothetical protein WBM00_09390 [Solirubrobacterales bacterium]
MTARPLILAEVGSTEASGDKAAWFLRGLKRVMPKLPHVRAVVWWADDGDYRGDFGVDSSPAALRALGAAIAAPRYRASREQLVATPTKLGRSPHHRRGMGRHRRP